MVDIEIVPARASHVPVIARNIREDDRTEVWLSNRLTPVSALGESYLLGNARTALADGEPIAMFGVASHNTLLGGTDGTPWLLATHAIDRFPLRVYREARRQLEELSEGLLYLENYVYSQNWLSIKWLTWLGFEIHEAAPYGPFNALFHRFSKNV